MPLPKAGGVSDTLSLFDEPKPAPSILERWLAEGSPSPVHAGDPETARQAARDAAKRAPILRERALVELAAAGDDGLTDWELSLSLDVLRTTAGKRRGDLVAADLVEQTSDRRPTDTGSLAVVWRITESGKQAAAALTATARNTAG